MSYLQCEQIGARPAVSADQASVSPGAAGPQVHQGNTSKTITIQSVQVISITKRSLP